MQTTEHLFVLKLLPRNYSFRNCIHIVYTYEKDMVLNNLQGLICRKTQSTYLFIETYFQNRISVNY